MMITDLIIGIAKVAQAIYDQVETVKANMSQCKRLAARVKVLSVAIKGLEHAKNADSYRPALGTLLDCLKECEQFVQAHHPSGRFDQFKAFVMAGGINARFTALSDQLEQSRNDLGLALDSKLVKDHDQDRLDVEADRKMLVSILASMESAQLKLDEIKEGQSSDRAFAEAKYEHVKKRQMEIMTQLMDLHKIVIKSPSSPSSPLSPIPEDSAVAVSDPTSVFYGHVSSSENAEAKAAIPRTINIGFKIPDGRSGNFIGFSILENATIGEIRKKLAAARQVAPHLIRIKFNGILLSNDMLTVTQIPGFSVEEDHLPGIDTESSRALSAAKTRFECTKILVSSAAPPSKHAFMPGHTPRPSGPVSASSRLTAPGFTGTKLV